MPEVNQLKGFQLQRRYSTCEDAPRGSRSAHVWKRLEDGTRQSGSQFADGASDSVLVMGKARLARINAPSQPRFKFLASLIAVILEKFFTQ